MSPLESQNPSKTGSGGLPKFPEKSDPKKHTADAADAADVPDVPDVPDCLLYTSDAADD